MLGQTNVYRNRLLIRLTGGALSTAVGRFVAGPLHIYIETMIFAYVPARQDDSASLLRRLLVTLVLAVVLSALEVDRRSRIVEPTPIVMRMEYIPRPLIRTRPYRPHYRRALSRWRSTGGE